ncbi:MAG: hypothetical protein IT289_05610 [Oligoflexia bacterium]|nr:hypothetical protein [Oligoflexia bacterium]
MRKLAIAAMLLAVPGLANAGRLTELKQEFKKVVPMKSMLKGKSSAKSNALVPAACTDFSGKWEGTCKDGDGNSGKASITIAQDGCTGFKQGIPDLIGKIESGNSFDGAATEALWLTMDWDKDGRNLHWTYGVSGKELGKASNYSGAVLRTMAIQDGDLVMQTQGLIVGMQDGQAGGGEIKESCTFDKK